MPPADAKEYYLFMRFWLWEYYKRHSPEEAIDRNEESKRRVYLSSSDIIASIVDCSFEYLYEYIPVSEPSTEQIYSLIELYDDDDDTLCGINKKQYAFMCQVLQKLFSDEYVPYAINMSKPIELICAEIRSEYEFFHNDSPLTPDCPAERASRNSFSERIRAHSPLKRLPKGNRNLPRAVGLWLWDYLHNRSFGEDQFYKAATAFHAEYHQANGSIFIPEYQDDSQLKVLLHATSRCIHDNLVYPMS